jgi:hypothetical protein
VVAAALGEEVTLSDAEALGAELDVSPVPAALGEPVEMLLEPILGWGLMLGLSVGTAVGPAVGLSVSSVICGMSSFSPSQLLSQGIVAMKPAVDPPSEFGAHATSRSTSPSMLSPWK